MINFFILLQTYLMNKLMLMFEPKFFAKDKKNKKKTKSKKVKRFSSNLREEIIELTTKDYFPKNVIRNTFFGMI